MSRRFVSVCAVTAVAVLVGPSASARVVERERYSESEAFSDAPCGYPLDVVFSAEGQFVIRDAALMVTELRATRRRHPSRTSQATPGTLAAIRRTARHATSR